MFLTIHKNAALIIIYSLYMRRGGGGGVASWIVQIYIH